MGLILALTDPQDGKDQTIKHHINRLKKGPEPVSRGLLPSLTVSTSHFSSMFSEELFWDLPEFPVWG